MIDILSMLEGVRDNHGDNYMARCPAHEDRSPSLSVKLCADGRVLIHCFAGCDIDDICDSLGLKLTQLMPELPDHHYKPVRRTMPARDALQALDHESLVVSIIAADVLEHKELDNETWNRLGVAVNRINAARAECAPLRHRP